jgi:hypothetical protein
MDPKNSGNGIQNSTSNMRRVYTDEDYKNLIESWEAGENINSIATILGIYSIGSDS